MQLLGIILLSCVFFQIALFTKHLFTYLKERILAPLLLSILNLIFALHFFNTYLYLYNDLGLTFHVVPIAVISYGPLVFSYVKIRDDASFWISPKMQMLFIPVLGVSICHIFGYENYNSIFHILYHVFIYLYSIVFLAMSIVTLYRQLSHGKHEWVWIYHFVVLLTLLIILIILDYSRRFYDWREQGELISTAMIYASFLITLISVSYKILYPSIFSRKTKHKASKLLYTDSEEKEFSKRLLRHIEENKPFLNPELTVRLLSEQLDIPAHTLSQLVNVHFKMKIPNMMNIYRIEHAKKLLCKTDLKILAVALESGFSNKTSFNRTFHKITSVSPSQFRLSIKK